MPNRYGYHLATPESAAENYRYQAEKQARGVALQQASEKELWDQSRDEVQAELAQKQFDLEKQKYKDALGVRVEDKAWRGETWNKEYALKVAEDQRKQLEAERAGPLGVEALTAAKLENEKRIAEAAQMKRLDAIRGIGPAKRAEVVGAFWDQIDYNSMSPEMQKNYLDNRQSYDDAIVEAHLTGVPKNAVAKSLLAGRLPDTEKVWEWKGILPRRVDKPISGRTPVGVPVMLDVSGVGGQPAQSGLDRGMANLNAEPAVDPVEQARSLVEAFEARHAADPTFFQRMTKVEKDAFLQAVDLVESSPAPVGVKQGRILPDSALAAADLNGDGRVDQEEARIKADMDRVAKYEAKAKADPTFANRLTPEQRLALSHAQANVKAYQSELLKQRRGVHANVTVGQR